MQLIPHRTPHWQNTSSQMVTPSSYHHQSRSASVSLSFLPRPCFPPSFLREQKRHLSCSQNPLVLFPTFRELPAFSVFSVLQHPVFLLDRSIRMTWYRGAHPKSRKPCIPDPPATASYLHPPFPARLSQTSGVHVTSPLPTPHQSTLHPRSGNDPNKLLQARSAISVLSNVISSVLPFSGCQQPSARLIALQLEMSALGFCDTMFFGHPLPAFFFWALGWAPPSLLGLSRLEFSSTQNLPLSFLSALSSSWSSRVPL